MIQARPNARDVERFADRVFADVSAAMVVGALGLPEPRLRALCSEAGFQSVRRVPLEDPLHALYEIRRD